MARPKSRQQKPFFSVIIPAYNEEKYLGGCLNSLKKQTFPKTKYETIVVDNGSTDNTMVVAKKYEVKTIINKNKGVVYARQAGLNAARGKYFVTTDADVILPADWLENIYHCLAKDKQIIAVISLTFSRGKDAYSRYILKSLIKINAIFYRLFKRPLGMSAANFAINKNVFKKIGGYNIQLPHFADQLEVFNRIKKLGKIYFNKNNLVEESDRRYKKRLFAFLFKDVFYYNLFNYAVFKITGKNLGSWSDIR